MRTQGQSTFTNPLKLILSSRRGRLARFTPRPPYPSQTTFCTHGIGSCVGRRVGLEGLVKRNTLRSLRESSVPLSSPWHIRRGADKSLARPRKKQDTANKLGIYSEYSPRSSIHFLAHCSNFCKPLIKIQNFVRPTRSPRQQRPPRRTKNGELSMGFFSPVNRW